MREEEAMIYLACIEGVSLHRSRASSPKRDPALKGKGYMVCNSATGASLLLRKSSVASPKDWIIPDGNRGFFERRMA